VILGIPTIDRCRSASFYVVESTMTAVLVAFALLMSPETANAYLMTLTFDDGAYDETIVSPGGEIHGPYDWVESNGIRATGFWATDVGTAAGDFQLGHTHIAPNYSGRPDGRAERMISRGSISLSRAGHDSISSRSTTRSVSENRATPFSSASRGAPVPKMLGSCSALPSTRPRRLSRASGR
jgi:hypothetical protein